MTTKNDGTEIETVQVQEEMKRSYLDYSMSVIVSRALPDVRDGLKPVHRRILYAMNESGNTSNKAHRKSSRVVGDVMGKYHPHGNAPIYDAMARLAQSFNILHPLIDGQGNFGSMDGDMPAAERYTEARLSDISNEILDDIDFETVDFQSNYDGTLLEPKVLPSKFPNLLVNGGTGIAVGMATSIPPHNLSEIIDACVFLIDKRLEESEDIDQVSLMSYIKGPDFPTGGIIIGMKGIVDAFKTGKGIVTVRSKTSIEKSKTGREAIIITEVPYQVNKAKMVEKIADLTKEKIVEGISEIRDESDRKGVRVVIELKKDATAEVVLNQLYKHSPLQSSVSYNMLAIVHGRPRQLNVKEILNYFIDFREEVVIKRAKFELKKAREKAHLLVGLFLVNTTIDDVIVLIKSAKDRSEALQKLKETKFDAKNISQYLKLLDPDFIDESNYLLSDIQANAILDLRLHKLTNIERDKITNDLKEITENIKSLLSVLGSKAKIFEIIKEELLKVKTSYSKPRLTVIEEGDITVDIESLIEREDMVITISIGGYIKRVPLSTYQSQKRGGRGRSGMTIKEEDAVNEIIIANTHDDILFFSTLGRVYRMKVYRLPLGAPQAKGRAMVNLLPLVENERISTVLICNKEVDKNSYLMFATSFGNVRRNSLDDFENIPSNGKRAMKLDEKEELISVSLCKEDDEILLSTNKGVCNRFKVSNVRVFCGRDSNGVRGIKLSLNDFVISMAVLESWKIGIEERAAYLRMASKVRQIGIDETIAHFEGAETIEQERFDFLATKEQFILTVTEKGYGKRSSAFEYRTTLRGSQGFTNISVGPRNGNVAGSFPVSEHDQIMLVTNQGRLIRCPVHDIRITGRRALGVIIFRIDKGESVVSVKRVTVQNEDDEILD